MATLNLGSFKDLAAKIAAGKAVPKWTRVAGAAADTDITVAGLSPGDTVVMAASLATAAASGSGWDNLLDELKITAKDTIQFDTTATTGLDVLLHWWHFEV